METTKTNPPAKVAGGTKCSSKKKPTLGSEIAAGLGMCILSVCGIFLNMQLVAKMSISGTYAASTQAQIAANGEVYAQTWFFSMVIAFLGTLAVGLIAGLPLVQMSSLGLSSVMVASSGSANGLSYANVLVLCFFGAVLYAMVFAVPVLRRGMLRVLPVPVRRALPAASGLLMTYVAAQLTGAISAADSGISVYGSGAVLENASNAVTLTRFLDASSFSYAFDRYHPMVLVSVLSVLVTLAVFLWQRVKGKHPYLTALLSGTLFFLVVSVCAVCINWKTFAFSLDSLWGRLWMVGGEDAVQFHLSGVLANFSFGALFSAGLDFSAYTEAGGNVVLLFVSSILTYLLLCSGEALSTLDAVCPDPDDELGKANCKALLCNAGINLLAPLAGVSPVALGKEAYVGRRDGARGRAAAVAAAVGFAVSAVVWVVPFLFSTVGSYDITFNMCGHYGECLQLMSQSGFAVADTVMMLAGLSMAVHSCRNAQLEPEQLVPFVATIAAAFLLSSLSCGVAVGILAWVLTQQGSKTRGKKLGLSGWLSAAVMLAYLVVFVLV